MFADPQSSPPCLGRRGELLVWKNARISRTSPCLPETSFPSFRGGGTRKEPSPLRGNKLPSSPRRGRPEQRERWGVKDRPGRPSKPRTPDQRAFSRSFPQKTTNHRHRPSSPAPIASARLAETSSPLPRRERDDRSRASGGVVRHQSGRFSEPRTPDRRPSSRSVPQKTTNRTHLPPPPAPIQLPPSSYRTKAPLLPEKRATGAERALGW